MGNRKNYYISGHFDRNDKELVKVINEMAETIISNMKCENRGCKYHENHKENLCTILLDVTDCEFYEIQEPQLSFYNKKTVGKRGN